MEQLTRHQFKTLVTLHTIGTSLSLPGALISFAKQDAWLVVLIGSCFDLLLIYLFNTLGKLYPGQHLAQLSETILGKWLGSLFNLNLCYFGFISTTALIWYVGNFINSKIIVEAPINYIQLPFVMLIIIALISGIKVIGRFAELCFPIIITFFGLLFILFMLDLKTENLFPIFDHDWRSLLKASLLFSSYTGCPLINFLFLYPNLPQEKSKKDPSFFTGYLLGTVIILILTLFTITHLGNSATQTSNSSYSLTMLISIPNLFERMEKFLSFIWLNTVLIKALLYYLTTLICLAQLLKLKDYQSLAVAFGLTLLPFSFMIYPNSVYQAVWDSTTWISYALITGFLFPLCLLIIDKIKQLFKN